MEPRRHLVASFGSAITLVLVIVAWVLFAPPQLGGQTSYVIVNGNSMEPGMHRGDLAIVRKASSYQVGDVVTYRHPQIGPVIHRIIERDGALYVFQGDNNDFIDSYHPAQEELIGELWIHVPNLGSWLARFHSPVYMAGLLFVAFIGLGGAAAKNQAKKPGRARRPAPAAEPARTTTGGQPMNALLRNWQDTASVLGAAAIAFFGLAWVAFNRPAQVEMPANIPYTQSGKFAYSAASADGRVYDTGAATSGEPVYRRLSEDVAFRFDYKLTSSESPSAFGSYHMVAEAGDQNGWKRTIELTSPTNFTGGAFTAEGVLRLSEVESLIGVLEEQSGVKNERYSISVRPQVKIAGSIDGTPFEDSFSPALTMALDKVQLKMDTRSDAEKPLTPELSGLVSTLKPETNTIRLLVVSLPVSAARALSLAGLGLVMVVGGWLLMAAVKEASGPRTSPFAGKKLRSPLVNVRGSVPAGRIKVVDVASLEDLGRIATRLGAVILQEARPGYHAFFVHDMELTYRYEALGPDLEHSTEPDLTRRVA